MRLWGERTDRDEFGVMGATRATYLCGPCAIACHPLAVNSVLLVGPVVDPSRGEIPLPLKDWVLEEGLNALKRIAEKKRNRLYARVSINRDVLHFPFGGLGELFCTRT